ncbi:MAG: hypothetical protein HY869_12620 [Chloroflexi bacterium]|nr:hypothetical protein [Chloroflexota bacterium]
MSAQGNQQEEELTPKRDIPDAWAGNGLCPICGAGGFSVVHLAGYADYFVCKHCELSFEVEQGGKLVRLKHIPDDYDQVYDKLRFRWVELSAVRTLALKDRPSLVPQQPKAEVTAPAPTVSLTDDEVMERAISMYRLGNQPKMIEVILLQAGAKPEQATKAFARLKVMEGQTAQKQSAKFVWFVAAAMVVVVGALGGLYFSGWFEERRQVAAATTAKPPQELLLKEVQKQLPDSAVYQSGPAKSGCPTSAADAARLFGGEVSAWEHTSRYAWQLTSTAQMVTLKVPDGMTVAYFKNPSLEFVNGYGPLTITNVNFAMITCE